MREQFRQQLIVACAAALIGGGFTLLAATVSNSNTNQLHGIPAFINSPIISNVAATGSASNSNVNVSIQDNRVSANDHAIVIGAGSKDVNITQNSNRSINNNVQINGMPYNK